MAFKVNRNGKYLGTTDVKHYKVTFKNGTTDSIAADSAQQVRNMYKDTTLKKVERDWKRDGKKKK